MTVYRIAAGLITKAALDAGGSYVIENWPLQSDQNRLIPWMVSDRTGYVRREREEPTADMSLKADGKYRLDLTLSFCTHAMLQYIDTYFSLSDSVLSAAATWAGKDRAGAWRAFQGKVWRPDIERAPRGAYNVVLRCVMGDEVT